MGERVTRQTFVTTTPEQTRRLGVALGQVDGPFGAGKTVLVQGLASGLGVDGYVSSPSFVLVNEHQGRLRLYHIDLYRLEDRLDPEMLDTLEEYLGGDGVSAVEWPGLVPAELRTGATVIRFRPSGEGTRRIEVETPAAHLAGAVRAAAAYPQD
jgi:tRNA threonylcarbamoyladenosine biosynthesis protein TsaE